MSAILKGRDNVVALSDYRPVQPKKAAPAENISFTLRRPRLPNLFRAHPGAIDRFNVAAILIGIVAVAVPAGRAIMGAL